MSDPTRYFDSCKSRAIETCLQDQADARCQGQSSAGKLCQTSQVPDTIERFCSDDVVCLDESDNEVIVEEEELEIVHQVHRQVPVMMPSPQAVPFEEWGTHLVTWGKKHKGKSFEATIRVDPQYFDWCQSRFTSLTPEMQDFVRYGQMRLSRLSAQCEAASPET